MSTRQHLAPGGASEKMASEGEWETLKSTMHHHYLSEDKSLKVLMELMASSHEFHASKSQYERHFKKWGFRKNLKSSEWKAIHHKIDKRKREGKDSDLYVDGTMIKKQKVRKETSRNTCISTKYRSTKESSPLMPDETVVCTPEATMASLIPVDTLPWFKFITSVNSSEHRFASIMSTNSSGRSDGSMTLGARASWLADALESIPTPSKLNVAAVLLASVKHVGEKVEHRDNSAGQITPALRTLLPSTSSDLLSATQDAMMANVGFAIYLLSNNLLEGQGPWSWMTRYITELLEACDLRKFLQIVLSSKGPTTDALAENIFSFAVKNPNIALLKQLLQTGYDAKRQIATSTVGEPLTPLQLAVNYRNTEMVQIFLDRGVDVNACAGENGITALHYAAEAANAGMCQLLIDSGADIDAKDTEDKTPLHTAVISASLETVDVLLAAGSDINCMDIHNRTVLGHALQDENIEILGAVVEAGANLDVIRNEGNLERLAYFGNTQLLEDLMQVRGFDLNRALVFAIDAEDLTLIEFLLDEGAEVNTTIYLQRPRSNSKTRVLKISPLTLAACGESVVIAEYLLERGARVDGCWWRESCTPIQAASSNEETTVADMLLDADANINLYAHDPNCFSIGDSFGSSGSSNSSNSSDSSDCSDRFDSFDPSDCSHYSDCSEWTPKEAVYFNWEILETDLWLDHPNDSLPFRNLCGTALQQAARLSHIRLAARLLDLGAQFNAPASKHGSTALQAAVKAQCMPVFRMLLAAGADVNAAPGEVGGRTAIQAAVEGEDPQFVADVIAAGADINGFAAKRRGITVLSAAIQKKDNNLIDYLLARNVNVNNPPSDHGKGRTPLAEASLAGNTELVQRLVCHGAIANDSLALAGAINHGHYKIIQILLEAGAVSSGEEDQDCGSIALQFAAHFSQPRVVQMIIEAGVDVNSTPSKCDRLNLGQPITYFGIYANPGAPNQTALCAAVDKGNILVAQQLLNAGAALATPEVCEVRELDLAIKRRNLQLVRMMLGAGANVEARDDGPRGRTPLQHAAESGDIDIVHALLEAGADVNSPPAEDRGVTALQAAAIHGYLGLVQVLLEANADVNAAAALIKGRTALEGAAEHGRIDVLQMLVDNGALIQGSGKAQYERALKFAAQEDHFAAKRLLESLWEETFLSEFIEVPA
ncbi:MAG: Ankyrin-2 [Alyxoria varia]|nr:MAG: Ankyrin-2 [Alyxoria varia]